MNSISYCADCGREIHINSHAYSETVVGLLCVNCREEETTEPNNLSEAPRPKGGGRAVLQVIGVFHDFTLYLLNGEEIVGFKHNGKKIKICPFCADSGTDKHGATCAYCKGVWS